MNFESAMFQPCKEWLASEITSGRTWDDVIALGPNESDAETKLENYVNTLGWPEDLDMTTWEQFVHYYKDQLYPITATEGEKVVAIGGTAPVNAYPVPSGLTSAWQQYSDSLQGNLSHMSIANIRKGCIWVLHHLKEDTRSLSPVKGLVTGGVQSGKTASMEGLVSMAADYNWNFFIILSGTIESLRRQTRDRFMGDLKNSEGGVLWRVLDFSGADRLYAEEELRLNALGGPKTYSTRYVTVCLKNKTRLTKLIEWLYDDPNRTSKLRVLIIDDEADQASINTAEITLDEEQDRCAINQLIVNLANGRLVDGRKPAAPMQSINYISYTATPYANVLNEAGEESLYPKDFICTLPEEKEYFGATTIFGNDEIGKPGFDIVRTIPAIEEADLKELHKGRALSLPESMKNSIAWFLSAAAILRCSGHKKSISMLVHTTQIQKEHRVLYAAIEGWLNKPAEVIARCKLNYDSELRSVTREDLLAANPDYPGIDEVREYDLGFDTIEEEIAEIISSVSNIQMDEDSNLTYTSGLHLCVDNSQANKYAEDGTYLRLVYPSPDQLKKLQKAPVFLVIGGNTLSRGLTVDGLVCTYFARNVNQADTLMQMARWFGYRKGYELLQRIWLTQQNTIKFKSLAKIDNDLKSEVELFMERGISPSDFGPRIRNTPEISKFLITAKKKSQSAVYGDFDFCGDSYETTKFDYSEMLRDNLSLAESFAVKLESSYPRKRSTVAKAEVWRGVEYSFIREEFLDDYVISEHGTLFNSIPLFREWMDGVNLDGKFLRWNVAYIDGDCKTEPWAPVSGMALGLSERTRIKSKNNEELDYIDIGSLRSGRDAICDVDEDSLSSEQKELFKKTRKTGKDIISKRCDFNLADRPLLLVYAIKKDGGVARHPKRTRMDAPVDIIGISIIVPGNSVGESHARSLQIQLSND